MFSTHRFIKSATGTVARHFSSLQAPSGLCRNRLSKVNFAEGSKRLMSGHGPDISKLQAAIYIIVGGGSFAAFGIYQAKSMRNRIEAFETGKTIPYNRMTDEEYLVYQEKFKKLHSEDDEDDEETPEAAEEETEPEATEEEIQQELPEDSEVDAKDSSEEASSKDTIIFVEAPEE